MWPPRRNLGARTHGTSGEIVAACSRLGPIELELFGGGIRPARVGTKRAGESPAADGNVVSLKRCDTAGECKVPILSANNTPKTYMGFQYRTFKTCAFGRWPHMN